MMNTSPLDQVEQMEQVLQDEITLIHTHAVVLEGVLRQYRQLRQSLRDSETRFRLLIESIKDYAIFLLDPMGHVMSWNPGAAAIKGYRPEEILGQHFSRFYTDADRASGKPARALKRALAEGHFVDEGWRVRSDGSLFWASVVITPIYDGAGQLQGFGKVTRDLTDRKRMEDEMAKSYQAQEAIRLRDAFLSVAAHELKTPITNLQGFAQVTLRHLEAGGPIDQARIIHALQTIDAQANKLAQLVSQLLDISRLQSDHLTLKTAPLNITELVHRVIDMLQQQTTKHVISLQAAPNVPIVADALRLEQVIVNILDNAMKFSPEGGAIVVAIEQPDAHTVQISVRDVGIGIPTEEHERIFEPFYRIYHEAISPRAGSGGLGLFISRQIVELHHGQISVEATPGTGSCFIIRLPSVASRAAEPMKETAV